MMPNTTDVKWMLVTALAVLVAGCASPPRAPTPDEAKALAPTGTLRVAFLANNAVHATVDAASGELKGPAVDLGKALAQRLGVPFEPVQYRTVAALGGSISKGEWDILCTGINADNAKTLEFSAPYLQVESGYLVGKDARIFELSEVDRTGIRIAVQAKGNSDVLLTQTLREASLIRTQTAGEAVEMVQSGQVHAHANLKTVLIPAAEQVSGSRVLQGHFQVQEIAIGVPKGSDAGARYVRYFVDELKARGFFRQSVERAGVRGLMAAP